MTRRQIVCHILVFLGVFAFQAMRLDSDPSPLSWMPEFNDEGFWNHSARCRALFGTFVPDEFNQGVIASPLFTLIQWPVFSLFGVSMFTARLLPLVSLWLTMLMAYFLVRRHFSPNAAILAVVMLGLLHEMLMYAKWSTPIITEACFLTAVLFFWERGRTGSRWWMAAAGASFAAASLTTLLALHCLPGVLLFVGVSWLVRKDVDRKRVGLLLDAIGAIGLLVIVGYYLPMYDQVGIFLQTIGKANVVNTVDYSDSGYVRPSVFELPFLLPFGSPGVTPVMMIVVLWLVDVVLRAIRRGVLPVLREMSSVHWYCLCWIVGAMPSLVLTPYMPPRRFAIFLVPLTILASTFAWQVVANRSAGAETAADRPRVWRILLWALVAGVWCEYQWRAEFAVNSRWLYTASIVLPQSVASTACVLAAAVAALYFLAGKTKAAALLLLVWFFAINISLDAIWYSHSTYTVRDAGRAVRNCSKPGEYLLNYWSWQLALENECLPLFSPWDHRKPMNFWFVDESDRVSFLVFDGLGRDLVNRFPRDRVTLLEHMRLCPVIFAPNKCRVDRLLFRVDPSSGEAPAKP